MKNKFPIFLNIKLLRFYYFGFFLLLSGGLIAQPSLNFEQIAQNESTSNWILVKPELNLTPEAILQTTNITNDFTYELLERKTEKVGMEHARYRQNYKGYPIEGAQIFFHGEKQKVTLINHSLVHFNLPKPRISLTEAEALSALLKGIGAETYAWESVDFQNQLKSIKQNPSVSYFPTGELVWMNNPHLDTYQLTYRFDVYALEPLSRKYYYINVETGELVNSIDRLTTGCFAADSSTIDNNICSDENHYHSSVADVPASGISSYVTANNSVVNFTSDNTGGQYILRANNLGNSGNQVIHTMNANFAASSNNLTEFTDANNYWESDPIAVSVHWGTIKTFEYYEDHFNRNSYDNNGGQLFSRVHYAKDYVNAFWDGTQMTYGEGDETQYSALTSLDVVSHEITHAVTQFNGSGGLIYRNESGALNESFSDIFGAIVEFEAHPDGGDWLIGEDFDLANGVGFRNMANPNLKNHPKTYGGVYWHTSSSDNGGVHSNSGVQNHWFYLLTTSGSGTNEYGVNFNIAPISRQDGAAIAYRNLTTYLTSNATYLDAVNGSIQSAKDLFGTNSTQHMAVEEAWCAVGLGTGCHPTISIQQPIANAILTSGTSFPIQWSTSLLTSSTNLSIEYTVETGDNPNWIRIVNSIQNSGSYNWFVPNLNSSSVRLRIKDKGDGVNRPASPLILDISETFSIQPCLSNPSFSSSSPATLDGPVSFTGLISGTSYEWSINGTIEGNSQHFSYIFPEKGYYTVRYTVASASGCINIEEQIITILPENANGFSDTIGVYSSGEYARPQAIFQAKNGDYLLLSSGATILSCFDFKGNKKWASGAFTDYPSNEYRMAAIQKDNGDFVIVSSISGNAFNQGNGQDKIAIIELSGTNGNVIGTQLSTFEGDGPLYPKEIVQTSNGGFVIGGEIDLNGQRDIFLLELDASKNLVKIAFFGDSSRDDYFSKIIQTLEGGYLFTGIQALNTSYGYFLAIKLDANLNTEWAKKNYTRPGSYSAIGLDFQINIVELTDGEGYLLLAGKPAKGFSTVIRPQSYLIQLDYRGNYITADYFKTSSDIYDPIMILDGVKDGQGGITFLAYSVYKHFLFNVDTDFNVNWAQEFSDIPSTPAFYTKTYQASLIRTGDAGYLVSLPKTSGYENYLYKTDQAGTINCDSKVANITRVNDFIFQISPGGFKGNHSNFLSDLSTNASIQYLQSLTFNPSSSNLTIGASCDYRSVSPVIASFFIEDCIFESGDNPLIVNNSQGADAFIWQINGVNSPIPFTPFNAPGNYVITLIAYNAAGDTSRVSKTLNILPVCRGDLAINSTLNDLNLFESNRLITSTATIEPGADVTFSAGTEINLRTGFHAKPGTEFLAQIEACQLSLLSCTEGDSLVLVALYQATEGISWTNKWDLNTPVSTWYGITVNGQGCVTDINLENNNLDGNIPSVMGNLASLNVLKLNFNTISGTIPPELGYLSRLEYLYLQHNQLSGSIPRELFDANKLLTLNLSDNLLSGRIPGEITRLGRLRELVMNSNQFSGSFPYIIYNFNLEYIYLYNNELSGSIPATIGNLRKLKHLWLTNNDLSGSIPAQIANITTLEYLLLGNNQLSGAIPPELGNLILKYLTLHSNQLSGCFPEELLALCSVPTITFGNNPDLPGGGDFNAFCNNGTGGCSSINDTKEESASRSSQNNDNGIFAPLLEIGKIYPNPFSSNIVIPIMLSENNWLQLQVFSATGQLIFETAYDLEKGENQLKLNGNLFPTSGLYYYKISNGTQIFSGKMTKF